MKKICPVLLSVVLITGLIAWGSPREVEKFKPGVKAEAFGVEVIGYPDGSTIKAFDYAKGGKPRSLIVIGSETEENIANVIISEIKKKTGVTVSVKLAKEVTKEDKEAYNLMLISTSEPNALLKAVSKKLPRKLQVTSTYPGKEKGVLGVVNGLYGEDKNALIVAGSDKRGTEASANNLASIIADEAWTTKMRFPAAKLEVLRFGYFISEDVAVAKEMGYSEFNGVNVQIKNVSGGPPMVAALTAGEIDGGFLSPPPAILAIVQGFQIKQIVGTGSHSDQYLGVLKDSPYKSIKDLQGKKIAVCYKPTTPWLALMVELKKYGIKAEIFEFPPGLYVPPLLAGQVDAAQFVPSALVQHRNVARIIHTTNAYKEVAAGSGYWFRTDFLDKNFGLLKKWMEGLRLAREFQRRYYIRSLGVTAEYSLAPLEALKKQERPTFDQEMLIYTKSLKLNHDLLMEFGLLKKPVDIKGIIDTRFAKTTDEMPK